MPRTTTIELRGLKLSLDLETYTPEDIKPRDHLLDVTLRIPAHYVLVTNDGMQHVFDYDPLIARISELANSRHFETQEYLVSLIARECAAEQLIEGADIFLYKTPVNASSGELGVRLVLDKTDLNQMRERTHSR